LLLAFEKELSRYIFPKLMLLQGNVITYTTSGKIRAYRTCNFEQITCNEWVLTESRMGFQHAVQGMVVGL